MPAHRIKSRIGAVVEDQSLTSLEARMAVTMVLGGRILSNEGHDDINQGQISARTKSDQSVFLIKQALAGFDEVTMDEVVRCPMDPHATLHPLAPPEAPLHQAIYAARPDVGAIVHSHAPCSIVFGALETPLLPISHEGACFSGRYGVFTETSHTVLSIETGDKIASALGDGIAVFLQNHGAVVVGSTVKEAVVHALLLERACDLQLRLISTGRPFACSSVADVMAKQSFIFGEMSISAFWDYYARKIGRLSSPISATERCAAPM